MPGTASRDATGAADGRGTGKFQPKNRIPELAFIAIAIVNLAVSGIFDLSAKIAAIFLAISASIAAFAVWRNPTLTRKVIGAVTTVILVVVAVLFAQDRIPAAPTGLAEQAASDSVTVTWAVSPDDASIKEYQVYRIEAGEPDKRVCVGKSNKCVDVDDIVPGSTYQYYVIAVGDNGKVSPRVIVTVEVPERSATLRPPVDLTAKAVSAHSVELAWTPISGQSASYSVLRDGAKIGESESASYIDSTVAPSSSYRYTVRVLDRARNEESIDSELVSVITSSDAPTPTSTPGGQATGPGTPNNFRLVGSTQSTITMSWSAAKPGRDRIAGYRIYRSGQVHRTLPPYSLSFKDTGLPAGTTYSYFVRAFDTNGYESPDSTYLSMSTVQPPVPITPGPGPDENPYGAGGYLYVKSSLTAPDNPWKQQSDGTGTCRFQPDGFHVVTTNYRYECQSALDLDDFTVELKATAVSGWGFAVTIRKDSAAQKYYAIFVGKDGSLYARKCNGCSSETVITPDILLPARQTVTVGIVAAGGTVSIYIDREKRLAFTDTDINSGEIGLMAAASQPTGEVVFGPMRIWKR